MKEFSKLTGIEKSAVLLLCLGEDTTAQVFRELSDDEVRMISRAMMNFDHIPSQLARDVMNDYYQTQKKYAGFFVDGEDFVKNSIASTGDHDRIDSLLEDVISGFDSRPLETISIMEPRMVSSLLQNEHPQTVALVLSTQKPDHTSKILSSFSIDLKTEVIYRMAKIEKVSPEVITQIEDALKQEIGDVVSQEQHSFGGTDKVVEILTRMEKGTDRDVLEKIQDVDQDLAEEIQNKLFTFEDLVNIDNRAMQMILREIKNETLTLSLKTASETVKDKIFNNISERAKEIIKEDIEAMGPVRLSDVEEAQQGIVRIALRLEEEGQIVIAGRGGQEILV
ncbi:MAG TPA: flagellar motor switch protein FliG [Desulfohalobiaceae bacterium]|nr:flagellar motor switch protein FliG [Desulfohalobiaceae bacterium]